MRYCDGSAECESECFDYSTDLTKVQVTESSRHKHRFLVKAPLRSVDDLYVKKKSLYGAKAKYLQSIGQRAWYAIIYYFLNLISSASGHHKPRLTE